MSHSWIRYQSLHHAQTATRWLPYCWALESFYLWTNATLQTRGMHLWWSTQWKQCYASMMINSVKAVLCIYDDQLSESSVMHLWWSTQWKQCYACGRRRLWCMMLSFDVHCWYTLLIYAVDIHCWYTLLIIHCWYTLLIYTVDVHCWYTLLIYTVDIHCWYTLLIYTVDVHCWYTLLIYTVDIHCWYTLLIYTVDIHCWYTLLIYTVDIHCWYTLLIYTVDIYCWCTLLMYTVDVHCWCTLLMYTVDVHCWCTLLMEICSLLLFTNNISFCICLQTTFQLRKVGGSWGQNLDLNYAILDPMQNPLKQMTRYEYGSIEVPASKETCDTVQFNFKVSISVLSDVLLPAVFFYLRASPTKLL